MVMPVNHDVDGQVWIGGDSEYQVDVKTGRVARHRLFGGPAQGLADHPTAQLVRCRVGFEEQLLRDEPERHLHHQGRREDEEGDAVSDADCRMPALAAGTWTRRTGSGSRNFARNKIAMFDTRTEKFQEWAVPTPWTNVYDAILDNAGYAWAGGMNNDRVVRLNTRTGEMVEYLLPRSTNIRRVNVDNSNEPADILGRQQPGRVADQGGAARLTECTC